MTHVPTDGEAVEQRAAWHDHEAGAWRSDGGNTQLARHHEQSAAALRALLSRAKAAEAERDALRRELMRASQYDEYHPAYIAGVERLRPERDALRARVEKLEAGIARAMDEAEDAGPKALKYVTQELRDALAAAP
ncbi:MAG TPA: hypothetical protein VGN96_11040, partial [Roseococcus sp.]|nr:hypothetical protein [Roseococcus sp.]